MKNFIKLFFVSLAFCFFITPTGIVLADSTSDSETITEDDSRKSSIVWRYKTIDGVLYKRQYNTATKKWIGSWVKA